MNNNGKKNHGFYTRLKRKNKLFYLRMLRQTDSSEKIALGAAIGVAAGILPTFFLGALLAIGVAYIVKANKVSAVLGTFIMNPVTTPILWTLSAMVGGLVFWEDWGTIAASVNYKDLFGDLRWALVVLMTGNIIIATAGASITYFVVKSLIVRYRERKLARRKMRLSGPASR